MTPQKTILIALLMTLCYAELPAQSGEELFNANCAACHILGRRLVGPDLLGVQDRRSEEWLVSFIASSKSMVDAGDPDAVAIFNEYDQTPMPDPPINEGQIREILAWITSMSQTADSGEGLPEAEPIEPIVFTQEDIEVGQLLYSGELTFANDGPTCISCHHVDHSELIPGGLLAKDLTHVHARMGEAGVMGILGAPPFPAMTAAYEGKELTEDEVRQLAGFLKHADELDEPNDASSGQIILIVGGGIGLVILLSIVGLTWKGRIRRHTKHDIYERQLKSV